MQASEMTIEQLKALAYDHIVELERIQLSLRTVSEVLKGKEEELKKSHSDGKAMDTNSVKEEVEEEEQVKEPVDAEKVEAEAKK